jgi:hypothetical protein
VPSFVSLRQPHCGLSRSRWAIKVPPGAPVTAQEVKMEPRQFQEILHRMAREDSQSDLIWDSTPDLAQANMLASDPETRAEGIAMLVDLSNRFPDSSNVCALVAQALAWDERQDEAIAFIRDRFPKYLSEELTDEQAKSSGKDECPVCGDFPGRAWVKEIKYACPFCESAVVVNERDIPRGGGVNVLCSSCKKSLHLPSQIWCPQCHQGLIDRDQIMQYIAKDNDVSLDLLNREGKQPEVSAAELRSIMERVEKMSILGAEPPKTEPVTPQPALEEKAASSALTQAPDPTVAIQKPSVPPKTKRSSYRRVRWIAWLVGMALVLILTIMAVFRKSDISMCVACGWLPGILVGVIWGIETLRKR